MQNVLSAFLICNLTKPLNLSDKTIQIVPSKNYNE